MKILVTGSRGFVGGALVEHLKALGHEVRGFSRSSGSDDDCRGDLLVPASIEAALAGFQPEVIYNMAAETDLKGPPANGYRTNTEGVRNLLAAAAAPSVKRVIWASSQLVCRPGATPASDTDYDPVGGYGASKAEGERLVRAADGGGKTWVIVRSTTIWGPGMSEHYLGALRLIRRGLYFHVGRAPLRKSYSYIENLSGQLASLAVAPAAVLHRRTFYLADSEPVELRSWSDGFASAFGRRIPTLPVWTARALALACDAAARLGLPAPLTGSRLNNMLTEYVYDTAPIETIHGPTAISNAEGVRRTAAWFLSRDDV